MKCCFFKYLLLKTAKNDYFCIKESMNSVDSIYKSEQNEK